MPISQAPKSPKELTYLEAICTADTALRLDRSAFNATNCALWNLLTAFVALTPDWLSVIVATGGNFTVVQGRGNQCTFFFRQNKCYKLLISSIQAKFELAILNLCLKFGFDYGR